MRRLAQINFIRICLVIRETPEADWGMYGKQVSLAALRRGD